MWWDEKSKNIKRVIRGRILKDKQYNGQTKKDTHTKRGTKHYTDIEDCGALSSLKTERGRQFQFHPSC